MHINLVISPRNRVKAYVEVWRSAIGILVVRGHALESLDRATKETLGIPLVAVLPVVP